MSTSSSAHSVVPLKPITVRPGRSCTSIVIVHSTKTSSSIPLSGIAKRSPGAGSQRNPASASRRASASDVTRPSCRAGPGSHHRGRGSGTGLLPGRVRQRQDGDHLHDVGCCFLTDPDGNGWAVQQISTRP